MLGFQYDALNRVTVRTVPERAGLDPTHSRDVYYSYDARGLQTAARFDSVSGDGVTNVYDGFGRLATSTVTMDGTSRTLTHLRDAGGNRWRLIHADGAAVNYVYDGMGRMRMIHEDYAGTPDHVLMQYFYDGLSRRYVTVLEMAGPSTPTSGRVPPK